MKVRIVKYPSGRMVTLYEVRRTAQKGGFYEYMVRYSSSDTPKSKWAYLRFTQRHGPYFFDGNYKVYLNDFEVAV